MSKYNLYLEEQFPYFIEIDVNLKKCFYDCSISHKEYFNASSAMRQFIMEVCSKLEYLWASDYRCWVEVAFFKYEEDLLAFKLKFGEYL